VRNRVVQGYNETMWWRHKDPYLSLLSDAAASPHPQTAVPPPQQQQQQASVDTHASAPAQYASADASYTSGYKASGYKAAQPGRLPGGPCGGRGSQRQALALERLSLPQAQRLSLPQARRPSLPQASTVRLKAVALLAPGASGDRVSRPAMLGQ